MQTMTLEQIKLMVDSITERKVNAAPNGESISEIGIVQPIIARRVGGGYSIVFSTPVGDILLRSVRQEDRRFASIDSAMDAVNQCGLGAAKVIRGSRE